MDLTFLIETPCGLFISHYCIWNLIYPDKSDKLKPPAQATQIKPIMKLEITKLSLYTRLVKISFIPYHTHLWFICIICELYISRQRSKCKERNRRLRNRCSGFTHDCYFENMSPCSLNTLPRKPNSNDIII